MFESVSAAPPDPILGLSEAFKQDPRNEKVNLTIGIFCNEQGKTPVLESVKKAEAHLLSDEMTKSYLGIDGLQPFCDAVCKLTLGDIATQERTTVFQTPGGTGALRVAAEFAGRIFPRARIWVSTPTWPNHNAIFPTAGLEVTPYPYLAADNRTLDFAAMMETLERDAKAGDFICLHACCHNPTGVDPSPEQWEEIAELTGQRGMVPIVDFAYHGFGDGLERDRLALVELAKHHDELMVCSSYSKNFGLYSERIGALSVVCSDSSVANNVRSQVKSTVRANYSNPPRHGSAIVATILSNPELREEWEQELTAMRQRIHSTRQAFVDATAKHGADFEFLLNQRGMFSYSGLTRVQVDWLKSEKAIYIVGSGRINVAGITPKNLEYLAESIAQALNE